MGAQKRIILVPLIAVAAALGMPSSAAATHGFNDWNPDLPGFPSNTAESARANCLGGSEECVDRTIGEMWRRFHTRFPTCEHNAIFSLTYIRVTEDIRVAVGEDFYPDLLWINKQDSMFARIYFLVYENWLAGRDELVPESWQMTFDAGFNKEVQGIGNLLMSMNAHINRDFPFIIYHAGVTNPDGSSKKDEHDNYNERLRALYKPMLEELAMRFDETIDDYDVPGVFLDDDAFFQLLIEWRETTWQNAVRLTEAETDAERQAVAADIEDYANAQAQLIYNGAKYGPGDSAPKAAREVRCTEHGGQRPSYRRAADVAKPDRSAKLRGRTLTVNVKCPDGIGPCGGDVKTRVPRKRGGAGSSASIFEMAGRSRFSEDVGEAGKVRVKLKKRAAKKLRKHPKRGVWVAVRSKQGPGDAVTERLKARF